MFKVQVSTSLALAKTGVGKLVSGFIDVVRSPQWQMGSESYQSSELSGGGGMLVEIKGRAWAEKLFVEATQDKPYAALHSWRCVTPVA